MSRTPLRFGLCVFLLMDGLAPWTGAQTRPGTASTSANIYVVGAVNKPGGCIIQERETVTILQALELAGGLTPTASRGSAKIIRHKNGSTVEIQVDLNKVLEGKAQPIELSRGDILFVPNKYPRRLISPFTGGPFQDPPMIFPHPALVKTPPRST